MNEFARPQLLPQEVNICSPRYFIARRLGECGHCRKPTQLFALAVPPGHRTLELDAEAPDETAARDTWRVAMHSAFLFYIEYLPDAVHDRLKQYTQCYRFGHGDAAMGFYWSNHCERCGCSLDDQELFCEPEGAFLPADERSARSIHLLPMNEGMQALAAGYAYEPQFFDDMSRD